MTQSSTVIGQFKCPKCGWLHIGISESDALRAVADFNEYYTTLDEAARESFGGRPAAIERFRRCFRCGCPSDQFVPIREAEGPESGTTLQCVIAPEFQLFRGLPLTLSQNLDIHAYIARCNEAGVPWDTLSLERMLASILEDPREH